MDYAALRERSLQPGGFGADRLQLWPQLLHAKSRSGDQTTDETDSLEPHPDERQIGLDTNRSFVLYPVEQDLGQDRYELQKSLNTLLVRIFRKRRKLSYFQGYHDIVTVLFLTLPPELQESCAEQMSLQRLRDAMGKGLEPIVSQLHILKRLLKEVDPSYATLLEDAMPLPYFALSNLLTLFSHDMPTLALVQHLFDYLLCRHPLACVYVAAAFILARKDEAYQLEEEGEEGMLHSLLSSLPDIYDGNTEPSNDELEMLFSPLGGPGSSAQEDLDPLEEAPIYSFEPDTFGPASISGVLLGSEQFALKGRLEDDQPAFHGSTTEGLSKEERPFESENDTIGDAERVAPIAHDVDVPPVEVIVRPSSPSPAAIASSVRKLSITTALSPPGPNPTSFLYQPSGPPSILTTLDTRNLGGLPPSDIRGALISPLVGDPNTLSIFSPLPEVSQAPTPTSPLVPPTPPRRRERRARACVSLSEILHTADELFARFPPETPALRVARVLGPDSVVHTWSEDVTHMPMGDEAERLVDGKVALPDFSDEEEDEEEEEKGVIPCDPKTQPTKVDPVFIFAGVVLVLGIAIAAYGSRGANKFRVW